MSETKHQEQEEEETKQQNSTSQLVNDPQHLSNELSKVLKLDQNIDEFSILDPLVIEFYAQSFSEGDQQPDFYSPPNFILLEHKLGISNTVVGAIIKQNRAFAKKFRQVYQPHDMREDIQVKLLGDGKMIKFLYYQKESFQTQNDIKDSNLQITQQAQSMEDLQKKTTEISSKDFQEIDSASKLLVLLAGENPTYLNIRYDLTNIKLKIVKLQEESQLLANQVEYLDADMIIEQELKFLALINYKYRKSSKSWAIRLQLLLKLTFVKNEEADKILVRLIQELELCDNCNIHEPRNYYVWTHRLEIMKLAKRLLNEEVFNNLKTQDLEKTQRHLKIQQKDMSAKSYHDQISCNF
eukprot:403349864